MSKSIQKRQQKLAKKQAKDRKRHQEANTKRQQMARVRGWLVKEGALHLAASSLHH